MKNLFIIGLCTVVLWQNTTASKAQTKSAKVVDSGQNKKKEQLLNEYESALKKLDRQRQESLTEAWELFKKKITNKNTENDFAFKMLYEFQDELTGNLNAQLYGDEKLRKQVNALAHDEPAEPTDEALEFEEKASENGFVIAASEGEAYLQVDPDKMKEALSNYLSPAGKTFLEQYVLEEKEPFTEDAGLLIAPKSMGERLLFWEKFTTGHSDFPLKDEAEGRYGMYLYFLLAGMDNTPLFDYDSHKADPEFLNAYEEILKQHPQSKTAGILKNYLEILRKNDFKESVEIQNFIQKYAEF